MIKKKGNFAYYTPCKGRKFLRKKLQKLIRCKANLKQSVICNNSLLEKNKIKFITQIFRWFRKDSRHYKLDFFIKKGYYISNNDLIFLSVKIQKAGWKKLLFKLNVHLKDYKKLKRRSYSLNFFFFITNISDNISKEITLDIVAKKIRWF